MHQGLPPERCSCGGHRISGRLHGLRHHSQAFLHVLVMRQHGIRPLALPCRLFHLYRSASPDCDQVALAKALWTINNNQFSKPRSTETERKMEPSSAEGKFANSQRQLCQGRKTQPMCYQQMLIELGWKQLQSQLLPFPPVGRDRSRRTNSRKVRGNVTYARGERPEHPVIWPTYPSRCHNFGIIREIRERDRLDTILSGLCDPGRGCEANYRPQTNPEFTL